MENKSPLCGKHLHLPYIYLQVSPVTVWLPYPQLLFSNNISLGAIFTNNYSVYSVAFLRHSNKLSWIVSHLKKEGGRLLGTIRYTILRTGEYVTTCSRRSKIHGEALERMLITDD